MKKLFFLLIAGLAFLVATTATYASTIELVVNGEFEIPDFTGDWKAIPQEDIPGWSNSSGYIELWNQGKMGSPSIGSDGFGTGQHHEVAYDNDSRYTTQESSALLLDGFLDFSFDAWKRGANGIQYSLAGSISGILAEGNHIFSGNGWENISHTGLSVKAGETFSLFFKSLGGGSYGAHIDQVSMEYSPVPEPSTVVLLGLGLIGFAGVGRKKLKG